MHVIIIRILSSIICDFMHFQSWSHCSLLDLPTYTERKETTTFYCFSWRFRLFIFYWWSFRPNNSYVYATQNKIVRRSTVVHNHIIMQKKTQNSNLSDQIFGVLVSHKVVKIFNNVDILKKDMKNVYSHACTRGVYNAKCKKGFRLN